MRDSLNLASRLVASYAHVNNLVVSPETGVKYVTLFGQFCLACKINSDTSIWFYIAQQLSYPNTAHSAGLPSQ